MSNPENPLAKYHTSSYHHILAVADGMATADAIVDSDSAFERPNNNPQDRYAKITIGDNDGGYVILIDSRRDANFNIQSVEWETILSPRTINGVRQANSIEAEGSMEIHEPFGIGFLEVLANITSDLERAPASLIFILKTIFVGQMADGTQEIISDVRPFSFNAIDITAVMDEGGASYKLDFIGTVNGIGKLPQISQISNGLGVKLKRGMTFKDAMKELEKRINERYDIYYDELAISLSGNDGSDESDVDPTRGREKLESEYHKVRYEIEVDPVYAAAPYLVGDQATTEVVTDNEFIVKAGPSSSITSIMNQILSTSQQLGDDANGKNAEKQVYINKITSSFRPNKDNTDVVIVYRVNRHKIQLQRNDEEFKPKQGEYIEFNYIYTGKNVDILDFNIKMDYGLAFFHTAGLTKSVSTSQSDTINGHTNRQGSVGSEFAGSDSTIGTGKAPTKRKEPLYLGLNVIKPEVAAQVDPLNTLSFDAMLSRHAALENVSASIRIIGNPQLLNETTSFYTDVTDVEEKPTTSDSTGASDLAHVPSLIKVNIKYPAKNDLSQVKDFWYRGFYNLYSITHKFEGGEFTQDIDMFSLPATDGTASTINSRQPPVTPTAEFGEKEIEELADVLADGLIDSSVIFAKDATDDPNFKKANILYKDGIQKMPWDSEMDISIRRLYPTIIKLWEGSGRRPVITSTYRKSKVKDTDRWSKHFFNKAIDLRANNLSNARAQELANVLQETLGSQYFVDFEIFTNKADNHIHVQYNGSGENFADDGQPVNDANDQNDRIV